MASFGQTARNRPALYKPTDFTSQQKRTSLSSEPKSEESKVIVKIQQRPPSQSSEEQFNSISSSGAVKSVSKKKMPASDNKKNPDQKQTGISEKDIDKIQQLKAFMAKQQEGEKGKEGPDKKASNDSSKRDVATKMQGKENKENKDSKARPPSSKNQRQGNRSSKGKSAEKDVKGVSAKQEVKGESTGSSKAGGARAKSKSNKEPNKQNANQRHQNKDGSHRHQPNASYYTQANFPSGRGPGSGAWMGAGPVVNNPGILKKPYLVDPTINASSLNQMHPMATKHHTVQAAKDKTEHKKSLDFVKNFFDTDPEVLHHRKQNSDKKISQPSVQQAAITVNKPIPRQMTAAQAQAPEPSSLLTQQMYNHSIQDDHRSMSMNPTAAQLQSLMAHNSHLAATLPSSYSGIYHQQHSGLSPGSLSIGSTTGAMPHSTNTGALHHHNSSPGTHHSASPGAMHHHTAATGVMQSVSHGSIHQSNSPNTYHTALNHPSSMYQHQNTTGYPTGMYSQMAPSALLSPGSNYQDSLSNNTLGTGMGQYSTYSGYFPTASHQSHIRHVQQELDPAAMQHIVDETMVKQKKWQKTALNKCGPINSKQARSLIEELIDGTYECMVCCDSVKWSNQVWSCTSCFHIFHLSCIRKWAKSEAAAVKDESGWRCPGCQNVSTRPPNKYYCFCGKVRDPDWNPRDGITPHSCGEVCKKKRVTPPCNHNCNELCHPGPCPSCPVMVTKHCPCGKTATKTRCGQLGSVKCKNTCLKLLKCGQHQCQKICHEGPCEVCDVHHSEECFCSKEKRFVVCGTGEVVEDSQPESNEQCQNKYSCGKVCDRVLACENHRCEAGCHDGPCKDCPLLPGNVIFCPCGKVPVNLLSDESRASCLDSIPTCDSFCGKKLHCGPKGASHLCMMKCHTGKCRPCQKTTSVHCRCAATTKEIACKELNPGELILCERKCSKKRKCGRHKCNQKCCIDRQHACNIICGKKLSCGIHKCDEVCHTGFCPTCWRAGFDELSCHCGATVLYPPIACGADPPECDQTCTRAHPCGHQPLHTCHSDEVCPPCTVLTTKQCMGGHEMWKNVPCHLSEVSCGRKCGKTLPCELHKCIKKCHKGACLQPQESCNQPCIVKRVDCAHPCNAACHVGVECPSIPCKSQVTISCRCGRKSANAMCLAGNTNSAYQSFNAEMLTNQLRNLQSGQGIDIASLTNAEKRPKFLDCDEECSRIERNKRLAEALGIENPDGGHFQVTSFSPVLKQEAKSQYPFVQMLESVLETLVNNAKKSSQTQIHHAFPPMNVSQRKIIHDLAEGYGCKTYSQDQEPKRNTVVVATKASYVPDVKLSSVIEREIMKQNPPQPLLLTQKDTAMVLGSQAPVKPILKNPSNDGAPRVDYFDDEYAE